MKKAKGATNKRNWFLVFVAALLIVFGLALVWIAAITIASFGWWSLLIGLSGLTSIAAAVMSVIKNDPSWILLDLIIPG